MTDIAWRPGDVPAGLVIAFSTRGIAPEGTTSPTEYLSRRFAEALSLPEIPIVRATQVHGRECREISRAPARGSVLDAGNCDVLATGQSGVALVVQTADCVPIVLAGERAIGAVHAGWRGSAKNAAAAGVAALERLGEKPGHLRAYLGPSIGTCCYEVGGEVASQFAGEFARRSCNGRFHLDIAAVNRSQLEAAGVSPGAISAHRGCTMCGGPRYASYRRDGAAAGRMIALVARLSPLSSDKGRRAP